MQSASHHLGPRAARLAKPWLVIPALILLCINTAWLGVRLAGGAVQTDAFKVIPAVMPIGDAAAHMNSSNCMTCHQIQPVMSHPTKVTPHMPIPAEFPLEGGQVSCTTCHRDTFADHAAATATQGASPMLRTQATGTAFCAQCHTDTSLTRHGQHPTAIAQAHLSWPGQKTSTGTVTKANDGITACLSCHDGTIARDSFGGLLNAAGIASTNNMAKGHPVGVGYPAGSLRHGDAVFRSLGTVDSRIQFTAGNVTCNSCHSFFSQEAGLLVFRNDNSALCLSCHAE